MVIDKACTNIEKLPTERTKYREWLKKFKNILNALRPGSSSMFPS